MQVHTFGWLMNQAFHVFTLGGVPVFVSFWYALLLVILTNNLGLETGMIWVAVVTFSILVHEFGHAAVARFYGLGPSVMLHGFGGLCFHQQAQRDTHAMQITAAGPAAGLTLGVVSLVVGLVAAPFVPAAYLPIASTVFSAMLFVNIGWSLLNLLPLYPLDGGQLFKLILHRFVDNRMRVERVVHGTGITLAVLGVIGFGSVGEYFMVIICLMLGAQNWQILQGEGSSGPVYNQFREAKSLLAEARQQLEVDPREAARLGHVVRATAGLPEELDRQAWEIIARGALRAGDVQTGHRVARHAVLTPELLGDRVTAYVEAGALDEARALAEEPLFKRLPASQRDPLLARL